MPLTAVHASTQDNSAGTLVATSVNEDGGGAGALQSFVTHSNKTTFSEIARSGLTAKDSITFLDLSAGGFSGSGVINFSNANALDIRAISDTPGAVLSGRVIFYDANGVTLDFSEGLTFNSDPILTVRAAGTRYPSSRQIIDAGQARQGRFWVDSISAGSWDVYVRPI